VLSGLLVEVAELGVPVRVLFALQGLGIRLQTEAGPAQEVSDGVGAHAVALPGQRRGQRTGGLGRPPQRRHRVPPLLRLHQGQQRRQQSRVQISGTLAPAAGPAHSQQRFLATFQLPHALGDRHHPRPGRPGHQPDPAVADRPRLRAHHQPALTLVQVRKHRTELHRQ